MAEVIAREFPQLPANIHVIAAEQKINTYDLMGNANLGLAFTTTAGLEMCMSGIPVISCGQTHYRGRGFTIDPNTYEEYFSTLDSVLSDPKAHRLSDNQIDTAWNYAYRFFFEYAQPFPWRLMGFWDDVKNWTIGKILSVDGQKQFGKTFRYLAGEPIEW
jgi:capsule polysaccharide export protein KpsC/LpsZ